MSKFKEDINELQKLGIMIDADDEGYFVTNFTKPVEDRPTLFFEIIQRMGARGFSAGNFKALLSRLSVSKNCEVHYKTDYLLTNH